MWRSRGDPRHRTDKTIVVLLSLKAHSTDTLVALMSLLHASCTSERSSPKEATWGGGGAYFVGKPPASIAAAAVAALAPTALPSGGAAPSAVAATAATRRCTCLVGRLWWAQAADGRGLQGASEGSALPSPPPMRPSRRGSHRHRRRTRVGPPTVLPATTTAAVGSTTGRGPAAATTRTASDGRIPSAQERHNRQI